MTNKELQKILQRYPDDAQIAQYCDDVIEFEVNIVVSPYDKDKLPLNLAARQYAKHILLK